MCSGLPGPACVFPLCENDTPSVQLALQIVFLAVVVESFIQSVPSIFMESLAGAEYGSGSLCNNEQNKFPRLTEPSLEGEGVMGGNGPEST